MAQKLTPPDLKQCQALIPNGNTFMTLGGRPGHERCENKPVWLATEKRAAEDGLVGSMTLCENCKEVFLKQMGDDYAILTKLEGNTD